MSSAIQSVPSEPNRVRPIDASLQDFSRTETPGTMRGERNHGAGCRVFRWRRCLCFRRARRVRPFGGHTEQLWPACHHIPACHRIPPSSHAAVITCRRHHMPAVITSRPSSHQDHFLGARRRITLAGRFPSRAAIRPDRSYATVPHDAPATRRHAASLTAWRTRLRPAASAGATKTETTPTCPGAPPSVRMQPSGHARDGSAHAAPLARVLHRHARHDDRSADHKSTRSTDFSRSTRSTDYLATPTPSRSCDRHGPGWTFPRDESPAKPAHSSTGS